MLVKLLRTLTLDTLAKRIWIAFHSGTKLYGKPGESKRQLLKRWETLHGKPTGINQYRGLHRPSEAAMTIAVDALDEPGTAPRED